MKKFGFTLAEVLITLGIIGVVAAMTLPALTANYKRQEYSAKIKKFNSAFSQAILRSEVDNGSALFWSKESQILGEDGNIDYGANARFNASFMKKYILPYMNYLKIDDTKSYATVTLADGSEFTLHNGSCIDIMYDINGSNKKPNLDGYDVFRWLMCFNDTDRYNTWKNKKKFFGAYHHYDKREDALRYCKEAPLTCTALLEFDGWEFKKDYPLKLL